MSHFKSASFSFHFCKFYFCEYDFPFTFTCIPFRNQHSKMGEDAEIEEKDAKRGNVAQGGKVEERGKVEGEKVEVEVEGEKVEVEVEEDK